MPIPLLFKLKAVGALPPLSRYSSELSPFAASVQSDIG